MAQQRQSRTQGRFARQFSTCISNVNYNPAAEELDVTFHNPSIGTWRYFGVQAYEAAALIEAGSRGEYFNQYIRDRYNYIRIA
ncbi:MAG: KTSC domain-containing protein [Patescibacteria group bacterium]|nr:KTSC domain-containing protein [Patescibacteria group bacterium]MDE2439347.1 KTSC domain-containing protein [Patescibacteria group bacterium]